MNKLFKIEKEDYYVNEEKKTVTCVLKIKKNNVYNELLDSVGPYADDDGEDVIRYAKLRGLIYRVVGKAKCAPEDEFDKKKGLIVARCRAYIKFNKLITNYVNVVAKQLAKDAYTLGDIIRQCKHDISADVRTSNKTLSDGNEH